MVRLRRNDEEIIKIYSANMIEEWERLIKSPFHKLEIEMTMRYLKKYLPKKGKILDAGGGPGRYTIELAKKGYKIVLLDLASKNLDFAKKQIINSNVQNEVEAVIEGSISDLSKFKNNYFDAVICLGSPLSHLNKKLREKAVLELTRVAKKNAPLFFSVMGKFGHLMRGVKKYINEIEDRKRYTEISLTGTDNYWGGNGYFHYFTLNELKKLLGGKIHIQEHIGFEGIGSASEEELNKLYQHRIAWKNWKKMHYALCTHPTLVDTSIHFMIIGKKK